MRKDNYVIGYDPIEKDDPSRGAVCLLRKKDGVIIDITTNRIKIYYYLFLAWLRGWTIYSEKVKL